MLFTILFFCVINFNSLHTRLNVYRIVLTKDAWFVWATIVRNTFLSCFVFSVTSILYTCTYIHTCVAMLIMLHFSRESFPICIWFFFSIEFSRFFSCTSWKSNSSLVKSCPFTSRHPFSSYECAALQFHRVCLSLSLFLYLHQDQAKGNQTRILRNLLLRFNCTDRHAFCAIFKKAVFKRIVKILLIFKIYIYIYIVYTYRQTALCFIVLYNLGQYCVYKRIAINSLHTRINIIKSNCIIQHYSARIATWNNVSTEW